MLAKDGDRIIEGFEVVGGAGLHQATFHYCEDESGQVAAIEVGG